jgi:hypothetical protein
MEFGGKLYLLNLSIVPEAGSGDNNDNGDDPGNDENGGNVEKDKDVEHHLEGGRPMDTNQQGNTTPAPAPTNGGSGSKGMQQTMMCCTPVGSVQLSNEDRVKSKILGTPGVTYKTQREKVDRGPEENIVVQLLSQFDSEAEEDEDDLEMDGAMASATLVIADIQEPREKRKGKEKWGPVLAVRQSNRIIKDGRSIIEKAQELKKNKNLEKPKGMPPSFCNSFAVLDNDVLLEKACDAGLSFKENNPDMFLPVNLGVEVGSVLSPDQKSSSDSGDENDNAIEEEMENLSPWVEVFTKRNSSKRKLVFRSNGSRPYMESKRS